MGSSTFWYTGVKVTGPWLPTTEVPEELRKLQESATPPDTDGEIPKPLSAPSIVVRTTPAELVQTDGEASFVPMEGTGLLYVENTQDDIFMDITGQEYYILTTGRWFRSSDLKQGPWTYVPADELPAEFAQIPEGSDKDGVLSSVAGTKAAREAVLDAQIPQTAKVDRSTTTTVQYDGEPRFRSVDGTEVAYAGEQQYHRAPDQRPVLRGGQRHLVRWRQRHRPVDRGHRCARRGAGHSAHQSGVQREVCGRVRKHSGCRVRGLHTRVYGRYVYGPTVIYGTGFYYRPWYGAYYYPRPVTYGFGMHYNPWTGWSMGFSMSFGWFNYGYGGYPHYGGWWGPPRYCPPHYHHPPHGGGGYYGHRPPYGGGPRPGGSHPSYGGGNVYDKARPGVTPSKPAQRPTQPAAPATRPATKDVSRPNNVYTDPKGDIYQRDAKDNWQRYNTDGKWKNEGKAPTLPATRPTAPTTRPTSPSTRPAAPSTRPATPSTRPSTPPINQMERQYQNRDRGQQRVNNYQQYQRPQSRPSTPSRAPAGGGRSMPSRGGRR